jgi:hypothetical protein
MFLELCYKITGNVMKCDKIRDLHDGTFTRASGMMNIDITVKAHQKGAIRPTYDEGCGRRLVISCNKNDVHIPSHA